jgi:hypothetical protein
VLRGSQPVATIWGALGSRVQLRNGLTRTKQKTDLGADDAAAAYHSFMDRGTAAERPVGNSKEQTAWR